MQGDPPAQAATNIVHVAGTAEHINGRYYDERQPAQPNPIALDTGIQQALLRISSELTSPRTIQRALIPRRVARSTPAQPSS